MVLRLYVSRGHPAYDLLLPHLATGDSKAMNQLGLLLLADGAYLRQGTATPPTVGARPAAPGKEGAGDHATGSRVVDHTDQGVDGSILDSDFGFGLKAA